MIYCRLCHLRGFRVPGAESPAGRKSGWRDVKMGQVPVVHQQVWSLTQYFFCLLFLKNHWFAWQTNDPSSWEKLFYFVPPSNSLVSVLKLFKGFLSWHSALQGPLTRLLRCFRNCREKRRVALDTEVPRGCQKQLTQTLIFICWKCTFHNDPWLWKVNKI